MSTKHILEDKLSILDVNSDEYARCYSDILIIDSILNPSKPELYLDPSVTDFFDYDNSKDLKHVKVKNYKHLGKIKFPLAQ